MLTRRRIDDLGAETGSPPLAKFNNERDNPRLYAYGEGVPQDDAEAVRWYRLAADQGYGSAQFALGHMYATGAGVTQDDAEAVRWYRLAAEQGHTDAQYLLGHIYANGEVVQQDDAEAVRWYRLAAEEFREVAEQGFAIGASCERRVRPSFCLRRRGERGSADGT